ncbi:MAG: zinc ribbon domain-containing protein [Deltaproteobacteria bacterium]|nr:zinc ribbon domain-containing protein [Deltaproteobacteria bacterium]MBW2050248.1 zinc ribbon domain-containing protein [Deltaproteobacteria bacterium]MBW2112748.1 zinc ribbon domain-containing protein [Deltaproteobacteria bacterium]MBW2354246.1 zinc ribbon domain-containing protein [Deltaproteobacteria bacterium]HDZ89188.1 zinc ribbon domain-containing protein [Deltaproteobacteria bacterium]
MKCPHCEKELPGSPCPKCGEAVFEEANYCMACGSPLKEGMEQDPEGEGFLEYDEDFDLEDRVLCPDGTCTGIIIDGKCTECGRAEGDVPVEEDKKKGEEEEDQPREDDREEKAG